MELIILRHGKAEPHGHPEGDGARALVERGLRQAKNAGALLKKAELLPDLVLTSPLVRARETAETFCAAAGISPPLVQNWLASGMRPQTALAELSGYDEFGRVLIVGHEPDLSGLIQFLLGAASGVEMKTGSIACLEIHPPSRRGFLRYLVPPKLA